MKYCRVGIGKHYSSPMNTKTLLQGCTPMCPPSVGMDVLSFDMRGTASIRLEDLKFHSFVTRERGYPQSQKILCDVVHSLHRARACAMVDTPRAPRQSASNTNDDSAQAQARVSESVPKETRRAQFPTLYICTNQSTKKRGTCPRFRATSSPQTIPIMIDKSSPVTNTNGIAVSPIINLINKHPSSLQSNYTKAS